MVLLEGKIDIVIMVIQTKEKKDGHFGVTTYFLSEWERDFNWYTMRTKTHDKWIGNVSHDRTR